MTPELEATVERVTETARPTEQITRLAAWTVDPTTFPEPCVDDVQGLFHALAEANERASLLRDTVRTRCAERDEARRSVELLKDEVVAAIRDHRSTLVRAEAAEAENVKLREILAPVAALHGLKPPHVVIGRTVREAFFALNPQQEGSRDHGL